MKKRLRTLTGVTGLAALALSLSACQSSNDLQKSVYFPLNPVELTTEKKSHKRHPTPWREDKETKEQRMVRELMGVPKTEPDYGWANDENRPESTKFKYNYKKENK